MDFSFGVSDPGAHMRAPTRGLCRAIRCTSLRGNLTDTIIESEDNETNTKDRPLDYFFYCRARPDRDALADKRTEAHWAFMDQYAATVIARGPTLSDDGAEWTGSMHIVGLPDAAAARVFAFEEPYYRAGVFAEVFTRRFRNELGRTMWQFQGDPDHNQRFLVIGHGRPEAPAQPDSLPSRQRFLDDNRSQVIVCGSLLSDDGATWDGGVLLAEAPDRAAAEALAARDPYAQAGRYQSVEIHRWRFGGRPTT
jgi:uncharacterized protein YciI